MSSPAARSPAADAPARPHVARLFTLVPRLTTLLAFPTAHRLCLLLALLLGLPTLAIGFFADDFGHVLLMEGRGGPLGGPFDLFRFASGEPQQMERLIHAGAFPWWTSPELKLAFLRPLSSALAALDYRLFGRAPLGYHLHSLLWSLGLVAVYAAGVRRLLPGRLGALALLLFTLDEARLLPAGWIANRNALVATLPALAGLWLHVQQREAGARGRHLLALPAFALGLAGGETALGVLGYLAAYELLAAPGRLPERLRALLPAAGLTAAYLAVHRALGYGASGSGSYLDPVGEPVRFLAGALVRVPSLVGGLLLGVPPDLWMLGPPARGGLASLGVLAAALLAWLLHRAWPGLTEEERRHTAWLSAGALLSLLPVAATTPAGRLLLVPGIGAAAALAGVLRHGWRMWNQAPTPSTGRPWGVWAAVGLLAGVHLGLAPLLWPLGSAGLFALRGHVDAALQHSEAALGGAPLSGQQVLVLPGGDALQGLLLPAVRAFEGAPMPRVWRTLSMAPGPHVLTRTGPAAFTLELPEGHFHRSDTEALFRDPARPLGVGEQVVLEGLTVTVLAGDAAGPTRLRFAFDVSLEDASLRFLVPDARGLNPFALPPVGGRVELATGPRPEQP